MNAQIQWEQFEVFKKVEIYDVLNMEQNALLVATSGGVYVSEDAGLSWQLLNEGFGRSEINTKPNNKVLQLLNTSHGVLARTASGKLFCLKGSRWNLLYPNYWFYDVENIGKELYFVGGNSTVNPYLVFDSDLMKISDLGEEPQFIKKYGSLFFNFSDALAKAGSSIVVSNRSEVSLFDGEVFEYIGGVGTDLMNVVAKDETDIWALGFSWFGPNPFWPMVNLYHYDGIMWSEVQPLDTNGTVYGLSHFYFEDEYHLFGYDQSTMTPHLWSLSELPVYGHVWTEKIGFEEGVAPGVTDIQKVGDLDYLFFGKDFIRRSFTSLGFANERRESGIYNGEVTSLAADEENLYAIEDEQLKAYDKETGSESEPINTLENSDFELILSSEDYVFALKDMFNDTISAYSHKHGEPWFSSGIKLKESYYGEIGVWRDGFGIETWFDFTNYKYYYYEYNAKERKLKEINFSFSEQIKVLDFFRIGNTIVADATPYDTTENSSSYSYSDRRVHVSKDNGKSFTEVDLGLYLNYGKESLLLEAIILKEDSIVAQLRYRDWLDGFVETRLVYIDNDLTVHDYYDEIEGEIKNLKFREGYWYGMFNNVFSRTRDFKNWETLLGDGIPEGANILSYAIDDEYLLAVTDGNGIFKGESTTTDIQKIDEKQNEITIYPNSVEDRFFVKSSIGMEELIVYNSTGKEVYRNSDLGNADFFELGNIKWSTGVYIAKVRCSNGVVKSKELLKN